MKKRLPEIWAGQGPAGAYFFELHNKMGGKITSSIHFQGTEGEVCREVGRKYAKEMSKRGYSEYTIINSKLPSGSPHRINIETLIKSIGKKLKFVENKSND